MISLEGETSSFPVSNMLVGERKQIGISVSRSDGVQIEFDDAKYRIYGINGEPQGEEGTPNIQGHNIFAQIPAAAQGYYYVEFTVEVNNLICKVRRTYQVE
jgi:hypothetical protein